MADPTERRAPSLSRPEDPTQSVRVPEARGSEPMRYPERERGEPPETRRHEGLTGQCLLGRYQIGGRLGAGT